MEQKANVFNLFKLFCNHNTFDDHQMVVAYAAINPN